MKPKVLITDAVHPRLIEGVTEQGFEVDYQPAISFEQVLSIISDYFGVIINTKVKAHKELIDKGVKLRFIARLGSGMEIIDVPHANQNGILCVNSPEGNRNAVAEQALGMLLSLMANINRSNNEVKRGEWFREQNRGEELEGKKIGILGFGNTGSAFAQKLSGFDVDILAYDKYRTQISGNRVKQVELKELFQQADVLSLHLPLTEETGYWIDDSFIKKFLKPIYLLNTSRGKILRTKDLVNAIKSGKVKGAGLDVLENERLNTLTDEQRKDFNDLINLPNVILTPHVAGWTFESKKKIAEVLLTKLEPIFTGSFDE